MSLTMEEGVEFCEEIVALIDDEIPDYAWGKAPEFFEDVRGSVVAVQETIEHTGRVSSDQERALNNWKDGVSRWIHDD